MGESEGVVDRMGAPDEVKRVVSELLRIVHQTGLERTLAIGHLVLKQFFGGSAQLWRDRRRNKNNSVRRLADCPECPLSRSALNQAIGVHMVVDALPAVRSFGHIGASHIGLVLPLDPASQEALLRRAHVEHWSVRRLGEEVRRDRRQKGERRGRPRLSSANRSLVRVRSSMRKLEIAVAALCNAELSHEKLEVAEIVRRVALVKGQLAGLYSATQRDSEVVPGPGNRQALVAGEIKAG